MSENGIPNTYSFTFLVDGSRWYLEHFESIVVRLDRLAPPPVVPFYAPERAFIVYLCWEQSRLHGNLVTLERRRAA